MDLEYGHHGYDDADHFVACQEPRQTRPRFSRETSTATSQYLQQYVIIYRTLDIFNFRLMNLILFKAGQSKVTLALSVEK